MQSNPIPIPFALIFGSLDLTTRQTNIIEKGLSRLTTVKPYSDSKRPAIVDFPLKEGPHNSKSLGVRIIVSIYYQDDMSRTQPKPAKHRTENNQQWVKLIGKKRLHEFDAVKGSKFTGFCRLLIVFLNGICFYSWFMNDKGDRFPGVDPHFCRCRMIR